MNSVIISNCYSSSSNSSNDNKDESGSTSPAASGMADDISSPEIDDGDDGNCDADDNEEDGDDVRGL